MKTLRYIFALFVSLTWAAQAATITWDGEADRAWMGAANWNPDGIPVPENDYVLSSDTVDPALEDFAGGSLTLNGSGAILRYTDTVNAWKVNLVTNNAGIIRVQHADRSVAGIITNLTLAGAARFYVDIADSSLALTIDALTFASGAAPYKYGAGALVLNIGTINATSGDVFRLDGGTIDFDGAADTQEIGLHIAGGQYVLDEARTVASLTVGGISFAAGTYAYADFQVAGKGDNFVDEGGSITVVAASGSEIAWDDGDAGRSWMAAANWSDDQIPSITNSYVISTSSAAAPADVYGDFSGGSLTINNSALLRFLDIDATNFVSTLTLSNATVRLQHASRTSGGAVIRLNLDGPAAFLVSDAASFLNINAATLSFGSEAAPQKTGAGRLNLTAANDVVANGEVFTLVTGSLSLSGSGSWEKAGLNISGGQYDLSGSLSIASLMVGTTNFNVGTYTHADFVAAGKGGSFIDNGGSITVVELNPPPTEIGVVGVQLDGANAVFSWPGDAGGTYALQRRESLVAGEWSNVVENISGIDGMMSATNDTSAAQAFYRITVE